MTQKLKIVQQKQTNRVMLKDSDQSANPVGRRFAWKLICYAYVRY